jgi:hypothetical protein
VSALHAANRQIAAQQLPFYLCPSYSGQTVCQDPLYVTTIGFDKYAVRNYAAMGGRTAASLSPSSGIQPEGIMYPLSSNNVGGITDGSSNTLLLVETREELVAPWIDGSFAALCARWFDPSSPTFEGATVSINHTPYFPAVFPPVPAQAWGPSSEHAGGAHHLVADGSVRFLSENIDVTVYDAISTRGGDEPIYDF